MTSATQRLVNTLIEVLADNDRFREAREAITEEIQGLETFEERRTFIETVCAHDKGLLQFDQLFEDSASDDDDQAASEMVRYLLDHHLDELDDIEIDETNPDYRQLVEARAQRQPRNEQPE